MIEDRDYDLERRKADATRGAFLLFWVPGLTIAFIILYYVESCS